MKQLRIPFIPGLEQMSPEEMEAAMETGAAKAFLDNVCWPDKFPYFPRVAAQVARSRTHLAVMYNVRGMGYRAMTLEDNGPVWEDSCCEFFISDPEDGTYYNFEMNCIGTLLASKRKNRDEFRLYSKEELTGVRRYSSIEKRQHAVSGKILSWTTSLCIPFSMTGMNPDALPTSVRANFYKCGDKTDRPHFLSWNPVETPSPDFHRPEYFGELIF